MSSLDPRLLLDGYAAGIFPMADSRDSPELFWVEPRSRAILPIDAFRPSRSLRRTLASGRFSVTRDRAFAEVVAACADRPETWINREIERAMLALHAGGHAHSIECWHRGPDGDTLAGGLYGVRLGRAFFGESMFSAVTDASKVALAWLVARLRAGGFTLLDCQFMTDHLASLGAVAVPRAAYLKSLSAALGADGSGSGGGGGGSTVSASGSAGSGAGAGRGGAAGEFLALDRLLEAAGAAGDPGAEGKFIAQLLGQTS